jgi:predicted nucleic acid-binding Zn ribbon protein
MSRDPELVGVEIAKALRARGWQQRLLAAKVVARWPDVVGEAVAAHCQPARLEDDGTLLVCADSSAWATQLAYLQGILLDRLSAVCGPGIVRGIRVRTADGKGRPRR